MKNKLKSKITLRPRGRKVDFDILSKLKSILDTVSYRRDHLIEYLHKIQDTQGAITKEYMTALASLMGISQTEVYEVATFYNHFDVVDNDEDKPAALTVRVCDSVTCEMNGAKELAKILDDYYKGTVRIQKVPCIGRCQSAPAAVVKFNPVDNATFEKVKKTVDARAYEPAIPNYIEIDEYKSKGGYEIYNAICTQDISAERAVEILEASELKGLGGAGFPAGRKWKILREQDAPRLLAINIDEGEPGTFKDRYYLESDPHRFFEGMLIASRVVGIDKIYIYLRDEYPAVKKIMEDELEKIKMQFTDIP